MLQGLGLAVVGESKYRSEIEAAVGGKKATGHKAVVNAALVAEPQNRYDPNAIAIVIAGRTCGYLARADAKRYRPVTNWAQERGIIPCCRADIYGGWREQDGTWADFGITLYIASPEKILDRGQPSVALADRPYANTACPYCKVEMSPLPKAKSKCKSCGAAVYVRSGPDGMRYLLQEADLAVLEAAWAESSARD
jgi:ssDNA-binding Zn-finger/Zn-ribbon topoisomerase 1